MTVLVPGSVFAGHCIEGLVGRGGMGVVYRARQLELDRVVALKVIAPELLDDERTRERFVHEARVAAAIEHPNVLPLYYAGEHEGTAYLAMRYIEGENVRSHVRTHGALAPERAADITGQAGAALDAIHAAGFVHRDIKPANVLLAPGEHVYVTDFGLARRVLTRGGMTRSGHWVGTLDYVAPEQIRGGRIDARADVYALGGVLYFMLTAHVPFDGDEEAKLWAHLVQPPPRPGRLRPGVPAELDRVVERAMAKDPEARQPSAGDLGRMARAACSGARASTPERMVARGAASPAGAVREAGLAEEVPTLTPPQPVHGARPATGTRARLRGRRALLVLGPLIAVGAAAAAIIATRGDAPRSARDARPPGATRAQRTTAADAAATAADGPRRLRVGQVVRRVTREPNGIAYAGGDLWVTSRQRARVTRIDAATGRKRRRHPWVGRGALDIGAGPAGVWVAVTPRSEIVRLDPRSGRVAGRISTPLPPVAVAVGRRDVWVVCRGRDGGPDALLQYAAGGRLLRRVEAVNGVAAIALGSGALWAVGLRVNRIERVDERTGAVAPWARLDTRGFAVVHAGGNLWVSLRGADSVARIDVRARTSVTSAAGRAPAGLAVAAGQVVVASTYDHTVVTVDPQTVRPIGRPLSVPFNPYAVVAARRHVWVTNVGADAVTRLDFE